MSQLPTDKTLRIPQPPPRHTTATTHSHSQQQHKAHNTPTTAPTAATLTSLSSSFSQNLSAPNTTTSTTMIPTTTTTHIPAVDDNSLTYHYTMELSSDFDSEEDEYLILDIYDTDILRHRNVLDGLMIKDVHNENASPQVMIQGVTYFPHRVPQQGTMYIYGYDKSDAVMTLDQGKEDENDEPMVHKNSHKYAQNEINQNYINPNITPTNKKLPNSHTSVTPSISTKKTPNNSKVKKTSDTNAPSKKGTNDFTDRIYPELKPDNNDSNNNNLLPVKCVGTVSHHLAIGFPHK